MILPRFYGEFSVKTSSPLRWEIFYPLDGECEKNMEFLQQQFADDFYFLKIYDETRLYVNYQDFALDESLKGEFVRKVLESDMDEEEKNILIRYGIQALAGEELQS